MHYTNDANGEAALSKAAQSSKKIPLQTHTIEKRNENNVVGQARHDVIN